MSVVLAARDLVKQFSAVRAVDGLSLDLREGVCFGLLGPNGAGKSTTIEMLEGLLEPTSGQVQFRGAPLGKRYRERIGIQFQTTSLQDHLTGRENLRFFSALYEQRRPLQGLIERCQLEEFLDRDARKLSGGQRQRLLLAIALINDPELIFLDEPTTGLDPQSRRNFWDLVQDIKREGRTVVLTTHYMEEADLLCDEIAIVDHGKIIAQGRPRQLLTDHFDDSVIELPAADARRVADGSSLIFDFDDTDDIATLRGSDADGLLRALIAAGVPLGRLRMRPRTLEDLFLLLTGRVERV